jgi:hypothetical protein
VSGLPRDGGRIMTARPEPRPTAAKQQRPKKSSGADRIPRRQQNGYYADHETGDRLRSVTTIINGGVPKEALIFWAANTCTDSAIEALPRLVAASMDPVKLGELRDWITRAHTRKKDERADVGTAVHDIIESLVLGVPIPPDVLADESLQPYLEHFLTFVDEWQIEFTASEMVVANPDDLYAGTLDYMLRAPLLVAALREQGYVVPDGVDLMGDTKTGGTLDKRTSAGHVHGVYPEAGLQMSAYRKAKVCWLRDGSREPMPKTAEVGVVLHLQPNGYRIYPALCGDEIYEYFRYAQVIDEWTSKVSSAKAARPIIGAALQLPANTNTSTERGAA